MIPRIFLLDDDVISLKLSERLIKQSGLVENVYTYNNAKEALSKIEKMHIISPKKNIILLDIKMPEMDGFEFLKEMKNKEWFSEQTFEIVLLSCHRDIHNIIQAYNKEIEVFLTKPLNKEKLTDVILQSEFV